VSGQAMVLSLMACTLLSSGVARLVTQPMYQELADMLPLPAVDHDSGQPPADQGRENLNDNLR
jgi:hypothetical protein